MCRTKTDAHRAMIPNLLVDNIIQKHIACLVVLGDEEWREGGKKMVEFRERERYIRLVHSNKALSNRAYSRDHKQKAEQHKKKRAPTSRRSGPSHRIVVTHTDPQSEVVPNWRLIQMANDMHMQNINDYHRDEARRADWIRSGRATQLLMELANGV